jgi:hypothetical protein
MSNDENIPVTEKSNNKNTRGKRSFFTFIFLLIVDALAILIAVTDPPPHGHPPFAAVIWLFIVLSTVFVTPIGIILGLMGLSRTPKKFAIFGLCGNLFLLFLVLAMWLIPRMLD